MSKPDANFVIRDPSVSSDSVVVGVNLAVLLAVLLLTWQAPRPTMSPITGSERLSIARASHETLDCGTLGCPPSRLRLGVTRCTAGRGRLRLPGQCRDDLDVCSQLVFQDW